MVAAARQVISILFGAGFTIAVAWALGRLLFRALGAQLRRGERDLLAGMTGATLLSLMIFFLCVFGLARTPVFLFFGAGAILLNWRFGPSAKFKPGLGSLRRVLPGILCLSLLFAFYALFYLSNSLAPEFSPDGQTYHLGAVWQMFRDHGFRRVTNSMFAVMPQGMEMLFLFAFAFGRHSAAATVHCVYLFALPFLILGYALRIDRPRAGACAALIAFLSPVAGIDGTSAYNDVALATTAFALFFLLEIWREDPAGNDGLLIPIGLLAGFCFALKYTGFAALVYAAVIILWKRRLKSLVPVAAVSALFIVSWGIRNWLWVANPVAPFANRFFPNPWFHVDAEDSLRTWFRTYEIPDMKTWLWAVTVSGRQLGGHIGPVFLLTPFALLALRSRAGRHCLLAAAFFLITYPQNIGARFLLPALPFLALAIALAFEFYSAMLGLLVAAAAVFAWPGIIHRLADPGDWHLQRFEWRAALGVQKRDVFLREKSPEWVMAQMLNYYVPSGKRTLSTTPVAESYLDRGLTVTYYAAQGELLMDFLNSAAVPAFAPVWNLRLAFPKRTVSRLRLVQTATSDANWSIAEMQFFNRTAAMPRSDAWRFDAAPFPWDIGLAFDGNPATRWRSWQPMRRGMHVDIDFGGEIELDRIELHCSHDQGMIEIHAESCDAAASCTVIPARQERFDDPLPGDLRRAAIQAVKSRGIDYLLVDGSNWNATDIRNDPSRWNLELIAERAGNRLYRLL